MLFVCKDMWKLIRYPIYFERSCFSVQRFVFYGLRVACEYGIKTRHDNKVYFPTNSGGQQVIIETS